VHAGDSGTEFDMAQVGLSQVGEKVGTATQMTLVLVPDLSTSALRLNG
jgi:hypothetical protein